MLTATLGSADVAVRNRAILGEGPIWDTWGSDAATIEAIAQIGFVSAM